MTTRKTRVDNYIAHTDQLIEGLTFFGKNYTGEDKRNLSATYSYAYWLLSQSIQLIDEGEKIYEMISTSLMYDFKEEMDKSSESFRQVFSSLRDSFFEEIDFDDDCFSDPEIDSKLLLLLNKEYKHHSHSFADAYQVLSHSRDKLHDAGAIIYRLLECALTIIKKQYARYRYLRNRSDEEYTQLWDSVISIYKEKNFDKDLEAFNYEVSRKWNDIKTDEEKLQFFKEQAIKKTEELCQLSELGDIWRRAAGNTMELACNLVRYECKDEHLYNKFISLICLLEHLDVEINDLKEILVPKVPSIKTVKEKKKRGRKKTECFIPEVDANKLADSIRTIHNRYYSPSAKRMEFEYASFEQTKFLVSLYFSLVNLELALSALEPIISSYYDFLTTKCKIDLNQVKESYEKHFAKLKAEGKDFHILNEVIVANNENTGGFSKEEYPLWQQMVAIAEEELKNDEYIKSLLPEPKN